MPIYEFFCPDCNVLFNFFSKRIDTATRPACPTCGRRQLERQVSLFAATGRAKGDEEGGDGLDDLPVDESRMESAVNALAAEAESINEDDPRAAARLMRKFSDMTGLEMNKGMQEALGRMEAGEDPEQVEAELGDVMETEDPFVLPDRKSGGRARSRARAPRRDPTLYEM